MPGYEVVGKEESDNIKSIFDNNGVVFAHGFDNLRDKYWVRETEAKIAEKFDVKYCQLVSSGSAGLYCALKALGIGKGDEVITSAFTFIATIEAILMTGATPVCVDIDITYNIDPFIVEQAITGKTKAVIVVHMAGAIADITTLKTYLDKYDDKIYLIEDACQAMGAEDESGYYAGTIGDMGVYSFDAGKIIQCGEGGAVVTNDEILYKKVRAVHDHGHTYDNNRADEIPILQGFNFRMTELQAAYLSAQLDKFDLILSSQRQNKSLILNSLGGKDYETRIILGECTGDSIYILFATKEEMYSALKILKKNNVMIKNVPDALNWHFAGNWKHIFPEGSWEHTEEILSRTIAVGVPLYMSDKNIIPALLEVLK